MIVSLLRRWFRTSPPPSLETPEAVFGVFLELFRGHGLACRFESGWIVAESGCLRMRPQVSATSPRPGSCTVQLDVEVQTPDGKQFVDSCGGVGQSRHEATSDAIQAFCAGSFHVIFAALTGLECSHCEVLDWEIAGLRRRVYCGPLYLRGDWARTPPQGRQWMDWMERKIKTEPLAAGMHWLRLYHFQCTAVDAVDEALLDNEAAAALELHSAEFPWPKCEQFYSTRLFMIIVDAPSASEGIGGRVAMPSVLSDV